MNEAQWWSMMEDDRVTRYLWSGETVKLRSRIDGLYLTIRPFQASNMEDEDTFQRYSLRCA